MLFVISILNNQNLQKKQTNFEDFLKSNSTDLVELAFSNYGRNYHAMELVSRFQEIGGFLRDAGGDILLY